MSFDATWPARVPKVELHLHLEGAIPLPALWELMQKYGGDRDVADLNALADRFHYRDFPQFLNTWFWKNSFIREYEDFTYLAEAVARDLARQNMRYAEVFYSPPDFVSMQPQRITEAVRVGLARVPEVQVALLADVVRNYGAERARRTVEEVAEVRDLGVIGIGIGGDESGYAPELFTAAFARARALGLHTTAHAGEGAGPPSIWGALHSLRVERIGHATRATEDEKLVDYLVAHHIPLEMCPSSNVKIGVVPNIAAHPLRGFFDRGALVTLNTDDPTMFGSSLASELTLLAEGQAFTQRELQTLILNGITASFLTAPEKDRLRQTFLADPAWNA